MPPGAKRRPPSLASQVGGPGDTIEAAVRALEALSGQEGQEDQNSPLLLNFLLPPSRPSFPKPTPTTPPKRNWKASSSASTSSSSSPSSPPDAVIRNNNKRDVTPDEFPHPHQRLSNGGYSLVDCWQFHGRSHCPNSDEPNTRALDTYPTGTVDPSATVTATPPPTSTSTSSYSQTLDMGSLPKGWEPKTPRSELYPIPAIVVCSFILAAAIAGVIVLCVVMRLRRKAKIDAADVERDRRAAMTHKKVVEGSDDEGHDDVDGQTMVHRQVATLASVPTGASKTRWRSRLLPTSLRRRRKRRKDSSSAALPQTLHTRVPPQLRHEDAEVDESPDDSEVGSNASCSRSGSHLSSRGSSRSRHLPLETAPSIVSSSTPRATVSVDPRSPATSQHPNILLANICPPSHTCSRRRQQVELGRRGRHEIVSSDDEDVEDLPAYGPRSIPTSGPPPHSCDTPGFDAMDDVDTNDEGVSCDTTQGHVATDDKAALERLAQMRSEPAVELSPPSPASSSSPSDRRHLPAEMNANVPDEDDIVLHEASAMPTTSLDWEAGVLSRQRSPRAESNHGMESSNLVPSSSKLSNDMLPAHISHTTRAPAQPGQNDAAPSYEEPHTPPLMNILPQPVIHEATAREYARLAMASATSTSTSAFLRFTAPSRETPAFPRLSTPVREPREVREDEDLELPSAPPFDEIDSRESAYDEVHPSAPPLDAFPEDNAVVPSAPPEWDE